MSAERIRQAAKVLRDAVDEVPPSPWKSWGMTLLSDPVGNSNVDDGIPVVQGLVPDGERPRTFAIDYVQLMQPSVALALADHLQFMARRSISNDLEQADRQSALALADTILGGKS